MNTSQDRWVWFLDDDVIHNLLSIESDNPELKKRATSHPAVVEAVRMHLAGNSAEWLLELHRLLKPGGILIASFMGRLTHQPLTGEPWDERGTGMKAIGLDNPWEKGGPSVFMSDWWVREHWGRAFEVEIIDAGIETLNQSWAVMKKKSVELTADGLLKEKPRRWWRRG